VARLRILVLTALVCCSVSAAAADAPYHVPYQVLAYHDVRDHVNGNYDQDQYAVSTKNLIDHFNWLKINGFVPVSLDDILAAQRGESELPEKAVLLTFDDGLKSVYTHVFPLLKLFGYPAVISIVTSWVEGDQEVKAAGRVLTADDFVTWDQVREMHDSGLIEIASHSHDLHRGITGNEMYNEQPAAVTMALTDHGYESRDEYLARIRKDLAKSVELIEQHTGQAPRTMTWPYGAFNQETLEIARDLGMPITLTLDDGPNKLHDTEINRHLVEANADVGGFAYMLLYPMPGTIIRAAQVDLDYVYDPDPVRQEQNLGRLLDRIKALQLSHVFLQAFADPDGDGAAQALYFPNRWLPMRADLFNRASWQLRTRSGVKVFAWLPLLGFAGPRMNLDWYVLQDKDGIRYPDADSEPRLSPFSEDATEAIREIYVDLANNAEIDGLLFHDDGRLNEFEDASPAAMAAYREKFGDDFSIAAAQRDPVLREKWTQLKTTRMIDLSLELAAAVNEKRPQLKTVRNLFAPALTNPDAHYYLAQSYRPFLAAYDYVALMAMPYLEGSHNPDRFYRELIAAARRQPNGLAKTIFELQTVDWRDDGHVPIPASELRETMRFLQSQGVANLAYYPDDFIGGKPELDELRRGISLAEYPTREIK
jgi:poly-beta-1,6-N-acetyl-D-glucosamine N-deacetylase